MKPRNRFRGQTPPDLDEEFLRALHGNRRSHSVAKTDYKSQQLCRQVERALSLAFTGECDDDILRELIIHSVSVAPNGSTLVVHVAVPARISASTVVKRLQDKRGFLRARIAEVITRKRVPELLFIPVAAGGHHE